MFSPSSLANFLAQTPILNAPSGAELLTWLECGLVLAGIACTFLGGIVLFKQAFGRHPSAEEDITRALQRVEAVEKTILTLATVDSVNSKIDDKFRELNDQRRTDINNLHQDVEHASRQIATLQAQNETQTATLSNIESKLDRWMEGELAEARRELAESKRK